jgi:hypothetical protein
VQVLIDRERGEHGPRSLLVNSKVRHRDSGYY